MFPRAMQKLKEKIRRLYCRQNIATKLSLIMITVITVTLSISISFVQNYGEKELYQKMEDLSTSNLINLSNLIHNTITNVDTYSRICLSNASVQSVLSSETEGTPNIQSVNEVENCLSELIANVDQIESIFVWGKNGLLAETTKIRPLTLLHSDYRDFIWYDERENGKYTVSWCCQDMFREERHTPGLTFSRAIRSLNTMKPIGYMAINISRETMQKLLVDPEEDEYGMRFAIFTEGGVRVVSSVEESCMEELTEAVEGMEDSDAAYSIVKLDGIKHYVSRYRKDDLVYVSAVALERAYHSETAYGVMTIILLVWQALLISVSAVILARWFNSPLQRLIRAMNRVKTGKFEKVEYRAKHYEIQNVIDVYNEMVDEIENLLDKTKKIERQKRKADLDILNMQIHPHFLYNTFDSIKGLFLLKRYDDANHMMTELAQFYKINLSKGEEYISVARELQMLKSYMEIQKMRFQNEFSVRYEVGEEVLNYRILKLVLQPLVENAIIHGIHGLVDDGLIVIRIFQTGDDMLELEVIDNGVGMSEEVLEEFRKEDTKHENSFGMMGTISRLRYCYGDQFTWRIESGRQQGTHITIMIPKQVF